MAVTFDAASRCQMNAPPPSPDLNSKGQHSCQAFERSPDSNGMLILVITDFFMGNILEALEKLYVLLIHLNLKC